MKLENEFILTEFDELLVDLINFHGFTDDDISSLFPPEIYRRLSIKDKNEYNGSNTENSCQK